MGDAVSTRAVPEKVSSTLVLPGVPDGFSVSSLRQRNHINFDQNIFRQARDLDGRASRRGGRIQRQARGRIQAGTCGAWCCSSG